MTELRQLTGARGIAAWAVVLYHLRLSIAGLPGPAVAVLGKGYLAVDFFFLLSGFVIWLAWHDRVGVETWRFWQKRVARIWPLHLAMLGFALGLALVLAARGRPDAAFPLAELPIQLLLVQMWGTTHALHWNDPAWSISAEVAAYLLFPLLARATRWQRWSTPALVAVAGGVLVLLHLLIPAPVLGVDIPRFAVIRCLAEFTAGTITAALYLRPGRALPPLLAGLALLAATCAGTPETLTIPAAFACLLLALARSPRNPLAGAPFHWLGEISYATYLSHFLLWKAVKLALPTPQAGAVVIAFFILLVLVASHLLYRRLELPAQRWINRLGRNEQTPHALPGHGPKDRLLG